MTLAQIMELALRQLDEDPEDISEFDDMFRVYANEGYRIAISEHIKPREEREMRSDESGRIYLDSDIRRIIGIQRRIRDSLRCEVTYRPTATGDAIDTPYADARYSVVCEIEPVLMENENDEPVYMPEDSHSALADYICYRHLINGNAAKQNRAQQYLQLFYQAMRRLRPQGHGSTRNYRNLYTATSLNPNVR